MAALWELKGRSKETLRSTTGFLRPDPLLLCYVILSNLLYLSNIPVARLWGVSWPQPQHSPQGQKWCLCTNNLTQVSWASLKINLGYVQDNLDLQLWRFFTWGVFLKAQSYLMSLGPLDNLIQAWSKGLINEFLTEPACAVCIGERLIPWPCSKRN